MEKEGTVNCMNGVCLCECEAEAVFAVVEWCVRFLFFACTNERVTF